MTTSDNTKQKVAPYQVDHLILLVGRNPLPNAVAGVLLTKPGKRISLIYSEGTADIRSKLQAHLSKRGFQANAGSKVDAADSPSIIKGVLSCLRTLDATVGLHYTGGTKAMSVHAFRALETWAKDNNKQPVFSYLDSRTLQIRIDPNDAKGGGNQVPIYVGTAEEIKIAELFGLHGWKLGKSPCEEPIMPCTAQALINLSKNQLAAWMHWRNGLLNGKGKFDWKKVTDIRNIALPNSASTALDELTSVLLDELGQAGSSVIDLERAKRDGKFASGEEFGGWIHGKWLEHHVLEILQNLAPSLDLHSCKQNIEPQEVRFDVDVVAVRGYQLFAFSCGNESEYGGGENTRLKRKLFEAFVRASQLGGDEARVAFVCRSREPEILEAEMRRDFDFEGRIRVFGQRHLANLRDGIEEWINSQKGTAT